MSPKYLITAVLVYGDFLPLELQSLNWKCHGNENLQIGNFKHFVWSISFRKAYWHYYIWGKLLLFRAQNIQWGSVVLPLSDPGKLTQAENFIDIFKPVPSWAQSLLSSCFFLTASGRNPAFPPLLAESKMYLMWIMEKAK